MDPILNKALADREALQRRLEALMNDADSVRAELASISNFLDRYAHYTGTTVSADHLSSYAASGGVTVRKRMRVSQNPRRPLKLGSAGAKMEECAIKAITQAARPLSIVELLDAVSSAGYEIGGERPANNLSSVLSRSQAIEYVRGEGWKIREEAEINEAIENNMELREQSPELFAPGPHLNQV